MLGELRLWPLVELLAITLARKIITKVALTGTLGSTGHTKAPYSQSSPQIMNFQRQYREVYGNYSASYHIQIRNEVFAVATAPPSSFFIDESDLSVCRYVAQQICFQWFRCSLVCVLKARAF